MPDMSRLQMRTCSIIWMTTLYLHRVLKYEALILGNQMCYISKCRRVMIISFTNETRQVVQYFTTSVVRNGDLCSNAKSNAKLIQKNSKQVAQTVGC